MRRGLVLLVAGFLLIPTASVLAQTTGDIEGKITDLSGVGPPGAAVEAKSPSLQGVRTGVSGRDDVYRFPGVPPGVYSVNASLPGFDVAEGTVRVALDATATLDLKLQMSVRENVVVSGHAPLVDVTSTTGGASYTNRIISKLPVARNYADIVRSNPGEEDAHLRLQADRLWTGPRRVRLQGSSLVLRGLQPDRASGQSLPLRVE